MQRKSKQSSDPDVKNRDRERMEVYHCKGELHMTVWEDRGYISVKLVHAQKHSAYLSIELPSATKEFIKDNTNLTTTQIWDAIIKENPSPDFSRKSVYAYWHKLSAEQWKVDPDEVASAKLLLDAAAKTISKVSKSLYTVEPVNLHQGLRFWLVKLDKL
ncbi:hypothetical protein NMY22_g14357 [Coprinellus aureogranulatus]|nr:hypothetical protein NMY22_g14357 [Coprinellus aureogranulatus]